MPEFSLDSSDRGGRGRRGAGFCLGNVAHDSRVRRIGDAHVERPVRAELKLRLVVVFGGVGTLAGTVIGAFSLGIVNKLLEPYAGAVLGKIAILVFIILFIQRRPRGMFALKGRAVEA